MKSLLSSSAMFAVLLSASFVQVAYADDPTIEPPFVSTRSTAEVRAELMEYKASRINPWANHYNPLKYFKSIKTREQVMAQFFADRERATAFNGEDSGSQYLSAHRAVTPATQLAVTTD
jgi:hypothetical protein